MAAAVRINAMPRKKGTRAESAQGATEAWRNLARAAIERRGYGAHAATARAAGCKPPTLTQLLDGDIQVSPLVPKISVYLEIPTPDKLKLADDEQELLSDWSNLAADDRIMVRDFIARLKKTPRNDA